MRRVALGGAGLALVVLDAFWLAQIVPHLPEAWPGALIALAFTVIGVVLVYSGVRAPTRGSTQTASESIRRRSADRWILAGVATLMAAFAAHLAFVPWDGSPDTKLRLVLLELDRYQSQLERLCGRHPLRPGVLSFQHTGIPESPMVDKRSPGLRVKVSVAVPQPDTLILTVTLPEITAEGVHSLLRSEPIAAGATLQTRGRCEGGTMFWTRLESTVPEERLQAALRTGIR